MKQTRILVVTHSAVLPSGMAEVTRLIFTTLARLYPGAYLVEQVGLRHILAVVEPPWPIRPTAMRLDDRGRMSLLRADIDGQQTFQAALASFEPDIVFAFNDPQSLLHLCCARKERKHRLILYVNADGRPFPLGYDALFRADRLITMSEFSKGALCDAYPDSPRDKVAVIYAPADTQRFKPLNPEEKSALRKDLLPKWMPQDAFILGWIGLNQWRKQVWVLYHAIHLLRSGQYACCNRCSRVSIGRDLQTSMVCLPTSSRSQAARPPAQKGKCAYCCSGDLRPARPRRDIFLWLHMQPGVYFNGGWPTARLEQIYGVRQGTDLHYTDGYSLNAALRPNEMGVLYGLWDLLLYLSGGEGFGIPAWEGMASGLPAVYTDYSAHSEYLAAAGGGVPVGGILQPEPGNCILRMVPRVEDAIQGVLALEADRSVLDSCGMRGAAFARRYGAEEIARRWHGVFQACMEL